MYVDLLHCKLLWCYLYKGVEWQGIKNRTLTFEFFVATSLSGSITLNVPLWCTKLKYQAGTTFPIKITAATSQIDKLKSNHP